MISAIDIYGRALSTHSRSGVMPRVRLADNNSFPLRLGRYLGPADLTDRGLLDDLRGPVLDVGCGPGRHLQVLASRGVFALGVDLSREAVQLAVQRGGRAIVGDIFDEVPGPGWWRSALLLDGNIGIGGSPRRLLARLRALLHPAGELLVELDPPHADVSSTLVRLETEQEVSAWFPWARVAAPTIDAVAHAAGFRTQMPWTAEDRWFARLQPRV